MDRSIASWTAGGVSLLRDRHRSFLAGLDRRPVHAKRLVRALLVCGCLGVVTALAVFAGWSPDPGRWEAVAGTHDGTRDADGRGWVVAWEVDGVGYQGVVPRLEFEGNEVAIEVDRRDPSQVRLRSSSEVFGLLAAAVAAGVVFIPAVAALGLGLLGRSHLRQPIGRHLRVDPGVPAEGI